MFKYDPYEWKTQYPEINQHSIDLFSFKTQAQTFNNNNNNKKHSFRHYISVSLIPGLSYQNELTDDLKRKAKKPTKNTKPKT